MLKEYNKSITIPNKSDYHYDNMEQFYIDSLYTAATALGIKSELQFEDFWNSLHFPYTDYVKQSVKAKLTNLKYK